jgi:ubiquinol-cytochrome c reductase subunit 7
MFGPMGLSLAPYIRSSKTLMGWVKPLANWYAHAAGYRKYGFKYDDLCTSFYLPQKRTLA